MIMSSQLPLYVPSRNNPTKFDKKNLVEYFMVMQWIFFQSVYSESGKWEHCEDIPYREER